MSTYDDHISDYPEPTCNVADHDDVDALRERVECLDAIAAVLADAGLCADETGERSMVPDDAHAVELVVQLVRDVEGFEGLLLLATAERVDALRERVAELEAELTTLRARAVPEGPEGWEVTEAAREVGKAWEPIALQRETGDVMGFATWTGTRWDWVTALNCDPVSEGTAPTLEAACAAADAAMGVARG